MCYFKKLILGLLLVLLPTGLFANNTIFKSLQISYVGMDYADVGITTYALWKGAKEANPLTKWYVNNPPLAIGLHTLGNALIVKWTGGLYKKNRMLAWIMIIGLNVVKAYVLYHNLRVVNG